MTEEQWISIKNKIKDNFDIEEENEIDLSPGTEEFIIFYGPKGKMKAARIIRPLLINKKTAYSHRQGSGVKVDYIYSEEEFSTVLKVYVWDESSDFWRDIGAGGFE